MSEDDPGAVLGRLKRAGDALDTEQLAASQAAAVSKRSVAARNRKTSPIIRSTARSASQSVRKKRRP